MATVLFASALFVHTDFVLIKQVRRLEQMRAWSREVAAVIYLLPRCTIYEFPVVYVMRCTCAVCTDKLQRCSTVALIILITQVPHDHQNTSVSQ